MVPSHVPGRYIPRVASEHLYLERDGDRWVARDRAGTIYTFIPARAADPSLPADERIGDDDLWLLETVAEQPKTASAIGDSVTFEYGISTRGCHRGKPEIRIERLSYSPSLEDQPLYTVEIRYRRFELSEEAQRREERINSIKTQQEYQATLKEIAQIRQTEVNVWLYPLIDRV